MPVVLSFLRDLSSAFANVKSRIQYPEIFWVGESSRSLEGLLLIMNLV